MASEGRLYDLAERVCSAERTVESRVDMTAVDSVFNKLILSYIAVREMEESIR